MMETAIIGAAAAVIGALIGAVVATVNARRHERVQVELARAEATRARREQLSATALAMASAEYERNPDGPHTLAAHYKVLETLLQRYDEPDPDVDLLRVRDELDGKYAGLCQSVGEKVVELEIARSIGEVYCRMCGSPQTGTQCVYCGGETITTQGEQTDP